MRVSRSRRHIPAAVSVFAAIIAMAGVSFAIALAWQNAQDSAVVPAPADSSSEQAEEVLEADISRRIAPAKADSGGVHIKTASEAAKDISDQRGPGEGAEGDEQGGSETPRASGYVREAVEGSVAQSEPLGFDYFDDAIFFGDSLSVGIPLYMGTVVPNAAVIAMTGVSPGGANSSPCIDVNGTRVTMLEAASAKGARSKVYIMLGANALDLDEKSFIDGYKEFVQSVKSMYPDATVYIQSMLPVTQAVNKVYPSANINNTRITQYNAAIRQMAKEQGVNYLDVSQCIEDANGFLPTEASPFDGMHLTPEYYKKWFDYLRTHIVKK